MAIRNHTLYTEELVDSLKGEGEEAVRIFSANLIPQETLQLILDLAEQEIKSGLIKLSSYKRVAEILLPFSPLSFEPLVEFLQTNKCFGLFSGAPNSLETSSKRFRKKLETDFNEYIESGLQKIYDDISNNMPGFIDDILEQQDGNFAKQLSELVGIPISKRLANVIAGILTGKIPAVEVKE